MDAFTRFNLELTRTIRSDDRFGSLLWILDKTKTAMGARMLRTWLEQPLMDPVQITSRQNAVAELVSSTVERGELEEMLRSALIEAMTDDRFRGIIKFLAVQAVHAAKIRDSRFCGHPCTAKEDNVVTFFDPSFQYFQVFHAQIPLFLLFYPLPEKKATPTGQTRWV